MMLEQNASFIKLFNEAITLNSDGWTYSNSFWNFPFFQQKIISVYVITYKQTVHNFPQVSSLFDFSRQEAEFIKSLAPDHKIAQHLNTLAPSHIVLNKISVD